MKEKKYTWGLRCDASRALSSSLHGRLEFWGSGGGGRGGDDGVVVATVNIYVLVTGKEIRKKKENLPGLKTLLHPKPLLLSFVEL